MDREVVRKRLQDGWMVAGYSCTMMAAGAMTQSILLQKGDRLESITVITQANKELGRNSVTIC